MKTTGFTEGSCRETTQKLERALRVRARSVTSFGKRWTVDELAFGRRLRPFTARPASKLSLQNDPATQCLGIPSPGAGLLEGKILT